MGWHCVAMDGMGEMLENWKKVNIELEIDLQTFATQQAAAVVEPLELFSEGKLFC